MEICLPDRLIVSDLSHVFPKHQKLLRELAAIKRKAVVVTDMEKGEISIHGLFPDEKGSMGIRPLLNLREVTDGSLNLLEDHCTSSPIKRLAAYLDRAVNDQGKQPYEICRFQEVLHILKPS